MYKVKLSCIITNYNQIKWIEEAVESVLNQNLDYSYEILIGDDGSNDGSLQLLKERYGQRLNIRFFVQERDERVKEFPNWRHSRLIFRLLDEAKGEFLSILDGDDYFCDMNHFQQKIDILDKEENRDCVACYGNMYSLVDGELQLYKEIPYSECRYWWLKDGLYIHLATAVIRKSALENVPRNIYFEEFADMQITFWLANKGMFYYSPKPCFVYRVLPNSIWHNASKEVNELRAAIVGDLHYQAFGRKAFKEYKRRRVDILDLYNNKDFVKDIDYKMWNEFVVKYHARVAYMLLNRDKLKLTERIWLFAFCFILSAPWKVLHGYAVGIGQLCNPKVSLKQREILIKNWWLRITSKKNEDSK